MKITTASNGRKTLALTHDEWLKIGEKTGWKEEFQQKGRAKEEGVTAKDVDPKELEMGKKIEQEHTRGGKKGKLPDREEVEKKISADHLAECPNYYTRLKEMEKECEKGKKK